MKFTIYQASRQGGRKNNQDRVAYSYSREALLMVVADGMGGHLHGEIAAHIAVQTLTEQFQKQAKPRLTDPAAFLAETVKRGKRPVSIAGDCCATIPVLAGLRRAGR